MGIRNVRVLGDDILRKKCKDVKEITPTLRKVIEDMVDTMYEQNGVGLAAPQVGVLRRIFVMDVYDDHGLVVMINPEILETDGSQTGHEGCLSVPGKHGTVTRPNYVKVRALDINMEPFEIEGTELFARCVMHENDHLDGIVYVDLVEGPILDNDEEDEEIVEEDEE